MSGAVTKGLSYAEGGQANGQLMCNGISRCCRSLSAKRDKQKYCKKDAKQSERYSQYHTLVKEEKSQTHSSKDTHLGNSMPRDHGVCQNHAGFRESQTLMYKQGHFLILHSTELQKMQCIPHALSHTKFFSNKELDLGASLPTVLPYRNLSPEASGNCHCMR